MMNNHDLGKAVNCMIVRMKETKRCSLADWENYALELSQSTVYGRGGDMESFESDQSNDARLDDLTRTALMADTYYIGTADHFHNLAVTYARINYEDIACRILEIGLDRYENNTDLLADYLKYAMACDKSEQMKCSKYFCLLRRIPMERWTWRSYDFSIDYLLALIEANSNTKKESFCAIRDELSFDSYSISDELQAVDNALFLEATSIAEAYISNKNIDEAYIAKALVFKAKGNKLESKKALEFGLKNVEKAPKCALQLADINFEAGNYKETQCNLMRCLRDAIAPQPGINLSYPNLLMGMSMMSELLKENENSKINDHEKVERIYDYFKAAEKGGTISNSVAENTKSLLRIFEAWTGVSYNWKNEQTDILMA